PRGSGLPWFFSRDSVSGVLFGCVNWLVSHHRTPFSCIVYHMPGALVVPTRKPALVAPVCGSYVVVIGRGALAAPRCWRFGSSAGAGPCKSGSRPAGSRGGRGAGAGQQGGPGAPA